MRKYLIIIPAATLLVVLAATMVAACDGGANDPAASGRSTAREHEAGSSTSVDGSSTTTESSSGTQPPDTPAAPERPTPSAPKPTAPPATSQPSSDVQFVCPEGGMDEVVALQEAVDQGHQPWRLSPEDVARVCVHGSDPVEPAGPSSYVVTVESTGERVHVELAQPLGPDGIWVVTSAHPV